MRRSGKRTQDRQAIRTRDWSRVDAVRNKLRAYAQLICFRLLNKIPYTIFSIANKQQSAHGNFPRH